MVVGFKRFLGCLVTVLLVGCGSGGEDDAPAAGEFSATGMSTVPLPAGTRVAVIWVNPDGKDSAYKFGDGTASGAQFSVSLPGPPPQEALIDGTLGVGFVLALAEGVSIPDGQLASSDFDWLARAPTTPIIYRGAEDVPISWVDEFPEGFSCGQCAPPADTIFDTFKPLPCGEMRLLAPVATDSCNWS